MGAMQAQDYHQALWAIALRTPGATLAQVEAAIEAGRILRTWPQRGTIHFVAAADARWMVGLSEERMVARDVRRQEQLGITPQNLEHCAALLQAALAGRRRLARPALMQLLEAAGEPTGQGRGYHLVWYLSQTGLLAIGPRQDKQQTFVLLGEWAPAPKRERSDALAQLARRYFASHGPATVKDFAWWGGLPLGEAKAALATVQASLTNIQLDGQEYWLTDEPPPPPLASPSVHLLPGFDEYLLGYTDRRAVLDPEHAARVIPGSNGVFMPTLVLDGRVAGTWKRTIKRAGVEIVVSPFAGIAVPAKQVGQAAERYAAFLELPLQLHILDPS